jgi:hypothetical protein
LEAIDLSHALLPSAVIGCLSWFLPTDASSQQLNLTAGFHQAADRHGEVEMELKISDGERTRYTQIYGVDPLACDGWLTRRMRHELTVLGCDIRVDFDLLHAADAPVVEAPAMRGGRNVVVQIERKRDKDASIFCVFVRS